MMNRQTQGHHTFTAVAVGTLLFATAIGHADDVRLHHRATIDAQRDNILLSDIAELTGPHAQQFADLVIAPVNERSEVTVRLADIRSLLDEAGAHWGKLHLNGNAVTVNIHNIGSVAEPLAMQSAAIATAQTTPREEGRERRDHLRFVASELLNQPRLDAEIAKLFVERLKVSSGSLLLEFDRRDEAMLQQSTMNARFELRPTGRLDSPRVQIAVRQWQNDVPGDWHNITVRPQVRAEVALAARDVDRRDQLTPDDVERREVWIAPREAGRIAKADRVVNLQATSHLNAGDIITADDLQSLVLIERGDLVTVRCVVGGVVVQAQAEARSDGSKGDVIQLRRNGERETFNAIVTGRREAIIK